MTEDPSGRTRWLEAGQELLRSGGIAAVKLAALTAATGLTTGSLYHHFRDMAAYLDALARYYGAEQASTLVGSIGDGPPAERLARLVELSADASMRPLDAAMRDWAGSSEVAAAAVREADEILLRFLEGCFVDLGHDRAPARTRAVMLLSLGVARIHAPWKLPATIGKDALALLAEMP